MRELPLVQDLLLARCKAYAATQTPFASLVDRTAGQIFVVTHIDIVPSRKDEGLAFVEGMAKSSRADPGNIGFYALVQSNRGNHVTLVEEWQDEESWQAHVVSSHMRIARRNLLPTSGALYDERLFEQL